MTTAPAQLACQVQVGRFATTREDALRTQRNVGVGLALACILAGGGAATALQVLLGSVERQAHTAGLRDVRLEAPA